ncbi:aldehyde dehydrogenase family protein [Streptomyces sp. IBSBF 2953]|nr:aldehyde dehydrogenase family protein [Streptomyces hayashii]
MLSASLDVAAKAATSAAFLSCGQVCTSAERLHVHEDVCDRFSFFVSSTIMTGVAPDWMW